jgi:hypothetical protein
MRQRLRLNADRNIGFVVDYLTPPISMLEAIHLRKSEGQLDHS